jgi:hypothetical protein
MLNGVSFEWTFGHAIPQVVRNEAREKFWMERYEELSVFKATHGHCRVPSKYKENKPLSRWVQRHREYYKYKNRKLSNECISLLNEIGFEWSCVGYADQTKNHKSLPVDKKRKSSHDDDE